MVPAPVERSQLPGHRQQIGKSAALSVERSPALAQRCGSERSAEFGSVNPSRCPHARARRRRIPVSSEADRPAPAGGAALRLVADVDSSFSRNCCWQIRGRTMRTMELGIGADVGFARSGRRWCRRRSSAASYRVIDNRSENLQHCQWSALPRSLSAAARKDQRNLAASTLRAALTRARGGAEFQ